MYESLVDADDGSAHGNDAVRIVYQAGSSSPPMPMPMPSAVIVDPDGTRRPSYAMSSRKLSVPFSEQRRRSSFGVYARVVMCAVDKSVNSKDAFYWYLTNVWRMDDLIVICHCPEPPYMPSFSFKTGLTLPSDKWREIIEDANRKNAELEEMYESICIGKRLRYKIRGESSKNAGEGLCRVAEEENVNLIVMGARGVGSVKRALGGSVSDYVIRNSNLPCLVIPTSK